MIKHGKSSRNNARSVTTLAVCIAAHGMPTNALAQTIDRQEISGNTMHVVLSPRDPYSNAEMKTA